MNFQVGDRVELISVDSIRKDVRCDIGDKGVVIGFIDDGTIKVELDDKTKGNHIRFPGSLNIHWTHFKKIYDDLTPTDEPMLKATL